MQANSSKSNVTEMMTMFTSSSVGLLEITIKELYKVNTEKAIYGKIFGKPSARLSTLLSVDREVLVIFSNFVTQQMRTIKTVRKIIKDSNGRLEPTVAIIFHCDYAGNNKLKKWGRENGISILPMYFNKDKFPMSPEEFEDTLCKELFSFDPFDIVGPVSNDQQFYGRRTEAQDLARQLQLGQIKCCLGIRKVGKTSIVNRVIDICKTHHDCYLVVIDCSKDVIWSLSAHELMSSISYTLGIIKTNADKYSALLPVVETTDMYQATQALLSEIIKSDKPIVFVFDELDYITPGSPTTKKWIEDFNLFWRNLRVLYQETCRIDRKMSLLISGVSSKWFRVESIQGIENAALAFVPEEYLSPLPRGASVAMIRELARVAGLHFDEVNAWPIASVCCDIPYWIRKACSFIHRRIEVQVRPVKPDLQNIKVHLDEFLESEGAIIAQVALTHLFRVYPELQIHATECLRGNVKSVPKTYLNILKKYGLLKSQGDSFEISGDMVREGLSLVLADSTISKEIENTTNETANSGKENQGFSEDWADELALINKRRNVLEKKLRGIVLNFLRYDSLMDKQKPSPQERILKRIEEKRRKNFLSIPADEIIEKLLWTELTILIDKEWNLFERLFSDKTNFGSNASLINDRFDAHAKDADSADLALYRRSLTWFEEKIRTQ